jgi:hypothetical protein
MSLPAKLETRDFAGYPPEARELATNSLNLLEELPLLFVATLLREVSKYDWLFPPERKGILDQLELLKPQGPETLRQTALLFHQVPVSPELEKMEWAAQPEQFSEVLTAYLWSSGSIEKFRTVAVQYSAKLDALRQHPLPQHPRACIVLLGQGARAEGVPLFERLRQRGTVFRNVVTSDALQVALEVLKTRAQIDPGPYRHWWIDGGNATGEQSIVTLSYAALSPVRRKVLAMMESARNSGSDGPEGLRSALHQMERQPSATTENPSDPVLNHFSLDLFADGSGTQIYSTTFVQWTAREVLRRAQPSTIVLHYAPRQSERPINELIANGGRLTEVDTQGSLIDADMGAYYTWLNLMRLPGAERDSFIACHEGGQEAVAVSPSMAKGALSLQPCDLRQILQWAS